MRDNGVFFIRSRTPRDWRFGKGIEVEKNGYVLDRVETGEQNLLNVFYEPDELEDLITTYLAKLRKFQRLHVDYDNPQNGITVNNTEVIFGGRV